MNDIIYLEPDAEITSVIDKIRKSQNKAVVLVMPRGGTLAQSIINLKLLIRSAKEHDKAIALVSGDKITANLANQLKIKIFSKVSDAEKAELLPMVETKNPSLDSDGPVGGIKVNTYQKYSLANLNAKAEEDEAEAEDEDIDQPEEEVEEAPRFEKRPVKAQVADSRNDRPEKKESYDPDGEDEPTVTEEEINAEEESSELEKVEPPKMQDVKLSKKHIKTEGSRKTFVIISAVVAFVLLLVASFFFVPKTKALIVLKTYDVDEKMNILVNKDAKADDGSLAVAGQILNVEKESTKTFNTTGKKNIGEKAKGTVTISNLFSYQNPIKLAKGTKITNGDKVFLLDTEATVPIAKASAVIENNVPVLKTVAGTIDVAVTAEQSGDTYNLSLKKFSVGSYDLSKLYAENKVAFSGGTNKEVKIVTEKDLSDAETALKAEMLEAAKTELSNQAAEASLKILESNISSEVISQSPSKNIDDEADSFDLKMKIKFFVIGFKESDIRKSVLTGIKQKIKADEMIVNPEESEINYKIVDSDIDDAQMKLEAVFKGKIGKDLSADSIKNNVKNKSVSSAQSYLLSLEGIDSISVTTWPSFWKRTSFSGNRIEVKFDYNK